MRRVLAAVFLSSVSIMTLPTAAAAQTAPAITYPAAPTGSVVDTQFGVKVADPYRWLENDVRNDKQVEAWVTAENQVTDAFLAKLPLRKGRYRYRFVVDGKWMTDPHNNYVETNQFGELNNVVEVD